MSAQKEYLINSFTIFNAFVPLRHKVIYEYHREIIKLKYDIVYRILTKSRERKDGVQIQLSWHIFRFKTLHRWILIVSKLPFDDRLQRVNQLDFSSSRLCDAVLIETVKWSLLLTTSSSFNFVPNKHNSWNKDLTGKKGKTSQQIIAAAFKAQEELRYISATRLVMNKQGPLIFIVLAVKETTQVFSSGSCK